MGLSPYRITLAVIGILVLVGLALFGFLIIRNKGVSFLKPSPINVLTTKVSYDIGKVRDTSVSDALKNAKKITVNLSPFGQDPTKYPILFTSDMGEYEYNIVFNNGEINVTFAAENGILANTNALRIIIGRLIIAASEQQFDKKITNGSLFDQQARDDHLFYLNRVSNDNNINQLLFVNIN